MLQNRATKFKVSTPTFKVLTVFFILSLFYGNLDYSGYERLNDVPFLYNFFNIQVLINNSFTLAEWSIIFISFYLLLINKERYKILKGSLSLMILLLTILLFFLMILNPNNNSEIYGWKLIFSGETRFMLLFVIFYISFAFLDNELYSFYISIIIRYGMLIILSICLIADIRLLIGKGISFRGVQASIIDGGSLFLVAIFQILSFALYLITKKKYFLIISSIFLITLILSYRRTSLLVAIISTLIIMLFVSFKNHSLSKLVSKFFSLLLVLFIFFQIISSLNILNVNYLVNRHLGAFSYLRDDESQTDDPSLTDSGHLEQSIITSKTFLDNLDRFWGSGFKNASFIVSGQSEGGIHNIFAASWAKHGIYAAIYQFILLLIFIKRIIFLFWVKITSINMDYFIFNFIVNLLLAFYFISGWVSGMYIFSGEMRIYVFFIFVLTMLKIDINNINNIKEQVKVMFLKI